MMNDTITYRSSPNTASANCWGNEYVRGKHEVLPNGAIAEDAYGYVKTKFGIAGFRSWIYSKSSTPQNHGTYIKIFYNGKFFEICTKKWVGDKTQAIREVRKAVSFLIDREVFKNGG